MITTKEQLIPNSFANEMFWCEERKKVLFRITKEYTFRLSNSELITIPAGFVTDFRSCPNPADRKTISGKVIAWLMKKIVELVVAQIGRHNPAVLIHDYLYTHCKHLYTRKFADVEMLYWLIKCEVGQWQRRLMYWGVRLGGKEWWEN